MRCVYVTMSKLFTMITWINIIRTFLDFAVFSGLHLIFFSENIFGTVRVKRGRGGGSETWMNCEYFGRLGNHDIAILLSLRCQVYYTLIMVQSLYLATLINWAYDRWLARCNQNQTGFGSQFKAQVDGRWASWEVVIQGPFTRYGL